MDFAITSSERRAATEDELNDSAASFLEEHPHYHAQVLGWTSKTIPSSSQWAVSSFSDCRLPMEVLNYIEHMGEQGVSFVMCENATGSKIALGFDGVNRAATIEILVTSPSNQSPYGGGCHQLGVSRAPVTQGTSQVVAPASMKLH